MLLVYPIPSGGPNLDNRSVARVSFARFHYLSPRVFQHRWSYILETKPQIINIIDFFSCNLIKMLPNVQLEYQSGNLICHEMMVRTDGIVVKWQC